ncbi:MAG: lysophospholipid acyltransferase family protein [Bdellovibrionales bacterium]|nr:lysophospholipid acyltransferase family protein [Bdellovibrionales bacterium]
MRLFLQFPFIVHGWILSWVPAPVFALMGRLLGSWLGLLGFRRMVVRENIRRAYPGKTEEWRRALENAQYRSLGMLFLEMFRFFGRFSRFLETRVAVEGECHLRAALAEGNGVFVMTAHLGNWEVLPACGAWRLKVPVTIVTKELRPAWLHDLVERTRGALGLKMAFEPKTMQRVMRALKSGEIVGFAMDQYAGAPVGARVPFFGVPVGSHTALAMLALRTGAPVVPAISWRKPDGSFVCRFEPRLALVSHGDRDEAVIRNTALFVSYTERWIREFPEQWLWVHRRWKGDLSPLHSAGEMLR